MKKTIRNMAALAALTTAGMVRAAEDGWQFKLMPNVWAMGANGNIGIGQLSAPVELKFSEAVKDLDLGGMLSAEARHGRSGILLDGTYLKLSDHTETRLGKFEAELEQWTLQAAAVYRVVDNDQTSLDLGAGVRYLSTDVTLSTPASTGDRADSEGIVDPILVARLRQQITERFYGMLYGDIGGFDASSHLTWQALAAAGYSFSDNASFIVGYRTLGYDYEKDAFRLDIQEHGIMIGVQFSL